MHSTTRRWSGAVAAVLTLASLSACGSDFAEESSAEEIKTAAIEAMDGVDSLRMEGSIEQEQGDVSLDIAANRDGECTGSMSLAEGNAEILSVDGESYLKGDTEFWTTAAEGAEGSEQIIEQLADKWGKFPAGDGGFTEVCDLDELLADLGEDSDSAVEKGEVGDVDGEEAVALTTEDEDGGTTTAWVATGEDHYILKLEKEGGDEPGSLTISDFNETVEVEAPPEDEVVDLSTLGG